MRLRRPMNTHHTFFRTLIVGSVLGLGASAFAANAPEPSSRDARMAAALKNYELQKSSKAAAPMHHSRTGRGHAASKKHGVPVDAGPKATDKK